MDRKIMYVGIVVDNEGFIHGTEAAVLSISENRDTVLKNMYSHYKENFEYLEDCDHIDDDTTTHLMPYDEFSEEVETYVLIQCWDYHIQYELKEEEVE